MLDYNYYKRAFQGLALPLAYVDMDLLDDNIRQILASAGSAPIRIASKSVRCCHLLRYILEQSNQFCGLMAFSIDEALFLADQGFDNLLIGYPETNPQRLAAMIAANRRGKSIVPMVDCRQHLQLISAEAIRQEFVQPICVDIDMSSKFPGLHFGAHRSPIDSPQKFSLFLEELSQLPGLKLVGMMGYEAQIAGVGDRNPFDSWWMNPIIRQLKRRSIPEVARRRQAVYALAIDRGHPIAFVNGGGTGSVDSTTRDDSVTEITVGSGFYSPGLFDYFSGFRYHPAAGFALEITRQYAGKGYTLAGGGYVASGSIGLDKRPVPHLPEGIRLLDNEGTGEVQTPFHYSGSQPLQIGDPVLFRHAKAGEMCERFSHLHLVRGGQCSLTVPTYRGQGRCFL